jgi:hypothetical protein
MRDSFQVYYSILIDTNVCGEYKMPEEENDRDDTSKDDDKKSSKNDQLLLSPEEELEIYCAVYTDSYMNTVEELNISEMDFPLFYTYYPFDVSAYILPDNSTCILFRGLASAASIEVRKADFEEVDKEIARKKFDHILCYPPSHIYSKDEAKAQAKMDVEQDVKNTKQLTQIDAEKSARDYSLKSIRMLAVVTPWVGTRKTKKAGSEPVKFAPEDLRIKENEDFSIFSNRLKNMETTLIEGKAPPPPGDDVTKATISADKAGTTTIPAPAGAPGTNISIEIKQPETGKGDVDLEKKEMEILRLKKTLYIQATDIENLKKKQVEMNNRLQNFEQMRQTVFRMNRKVFDTDAKVIKLEKINREMMAKVAEMRVEQREENKKMRRFITEKVKKARNQALIVAGIAIGIALFSLPFLIMLLIRYWGEIKSIIGL